MKVVFHADALNDFVQWAQEDRKKFKRLAELIEGCRRNPFAGAGKPEPLRGNWAGWWSRRIDQEHRLVYRVVGSGSSQVLEIAQCRGHYS